MQIIKTRLAAAVGAAALAAGFTSTASAGCSPFESVPAPGQRAAPSTPAPKAPAVNGYEGVQLVQAASITGFQRADWHFDDPVIVGLWHIQFILGEGTPDEMVIDDGFATWHADGTELMNSGRPPITGSFCMGVWKQTGPFSFSLNHFALSWDETGKNFIGPTNIRETVTVDRRGNSYTGHFTITQFDPDGNNLGGPSGTIKATRINP
jgi:hypothetical protein